VRPQKRRTYWQVQILIPESHRIGVALPVNDEILTALTSHKRNTSLSDLNGWNRLRSTRCKSCLRIGIRLTQREHSHQRDCSPGKSRTRNLIHRSIGFAHRGSPAVESSVQQAGYLTRCTSRTSGQRVLEMVRLNRGNHPEHLMQHLSRAPDRVDLGNER